MIRFIKGQRDVEIDAKSLILKPLRDIYYAQEDRTSATKILTYIHVVSQVDPDAPFYEVREDEIRELAARNIWGPDWKQEAEGGLGQYEQLIADYLNAYDKPERRGVRIYNNLLDQIDDLIVSTPPSISKSINVNTGTFSWQQNTKAITDLMKSKNSIVKERDELADRIKNSGQKNAKVRGEKALSFSEKKQLERELRGNNDEQRTEDTQGEESLSEELSESNSDS